MNVTFRRSIAMQPSVQSFFDHATSTVTHVVSAGPGSACAIIDSVLDFDPKSGRTSTRSADAVIAYVRAQELRVDWLLETHAHADHLSAAPYLAEQLDGRIAIGASSAPSSMRSPTSSTPIRARRRTARSSTTCSRPTKSS